MKKMFFNIEKKKIDHKNNLLIKPENFNSGEFICCVTNVSVPKELNCCSTNVYKTNVSVPGELNT